MKCEKTFSIVFEYEENTEKMIKGTLLKYGEPNEDALNETMVLHGRMHDQFPEVFRNTKVICCDNVPAEEVEKMINYTGYVGTWFERRQKEVKLNDNKN